VDRRYRRFFAFAAARLKRATTTARQAVLTDVDVTSDRRAANLAEAEAFAASAAELGAAVAKAAQVRAYLDVTGAAETPEARALLARLWDRMPPRPSELIRRVVAEQLGAPPEARFARWDDTPIAAASLGQVHEAEDADGRRFAVKVQYPGVAEALRDDLSSASLLRRIVGGELGGGAAADALAVMRTQLLGELDYVAEASWLERFGRAFARDPDIVIPAVDRARSTARVLTMERLAGRPLFELFDSNGADAEATRNRAARAIFRFAFGAPLVHGIFNADPHPGNYLILDGTPALGFVDFGSAVELSDDMRDADRRLFLAMIHRDGEALRHAAHAEGLVAHATVFEGETWREWEKTLAAPFLQRGEFALGPAHVTQLIRTTGELLRARRIALPPGSILLWRQRLGALAVLAALAPRLNFRKLLADLLDDGRNPISLYDRWR
jgi:predicted unusual protein kinase regulating ubiquinone biosynthesis (AarF/ABC1/UbiB family)